MTITASRKTASRAHDAWAPLALSLLLAACATQPPSPPSPPQPPATPTRPTPPPPSPSPSPSPSSASAPAETSRAPSQDPATTNKAQTAGAKSPATSAATADASADPNAATGAPAGTTASGAGAAPKPPGTASSSTGTGAAPSGKTAAAAAQSGGGAMTEAERNAAWDQRFDGTLGDFDQRLAREQAALEKRRAAGGAGGSGDQDVAQGGAGGSTGSMPAEIPASGEGDAAAQGSTTAGGSLGNPTPGPRYPAPTGTPDGRDDDVVAKQLREAAEKEADPALRAKLWDEYRKYKARKS